MIPQHCRYRAEEVMNKKIRRQTNQIFSRVRQSIDRPPSATTKVKQVDSNPDSRYHSVNK